MGNFSINVDNFSVNVDNFSINVDNLEGIRTKELEMDAIFQFLSLTPIIITVVIWIKTI